jgi:two-component system sensor histidine kinase PilS (NtrC family)
VIGVLDDGAIGSVVNLRALGIEHQGELLVRQKLGWLIAVRAMVGTLLLGGATLAQITAPGSFPVDPFFFLIALIYALTLFYAVTLRLAGRHRWLVDVQLAGDAVIVSAFISLTGGVTSFFSSLYALPIVAGSTIRSRRGGLLVATLSAFCYLALVGAQYVTANGMFPSARVLVDAALLPSGSVAQYVAVLNVSGFFVIALLSGSLAESARTADARLAQASTEIADLQALNAHVIDSLPSGLLTADSTQRVLTFNHAAEAICGVPFESVIGRQVADVLQLPPSLVETLNARLASGGARRLEFRYRRGDAKDIDIGLSATHLETPGGRIGFLITFQDLTDIKRLERDVRLQQRLAAVGEMAAGIAHEIRNPLASMSGSIQILRQELPLSAEQEQLMDIVLRESERLNTTIRSFLAYARPQKFAITRFNLYRTLNDTALLLRNSVEVNDGHRVEVVVPRELSHEADEGQIKQIIWNLATNGLRAMPDGGLLRLAAAVDNEHGGITITVDDQGIGIPPEEIDGLFQPFHGTFARGSGLGLAIVHRIVTDYHGEIQVSSRKGAGTTVRVHLPARAEVTT